MEHYTMITSEDKEYSITPLGEIKEPYSTDRYFKSREEQYKDVGITTKYEGTMIVTDERGVKFEATLINKKVKHSYPKGWRRVFIEDFMSSITKISENRKVMIFEFIMKNLNPQNQLLYTQKAIADKLGISITTVSLTFKALLENDVMRKESKDKVGGYIINPSLVAAFGSDSKNRMLIIKYDELEKEV